MSLEHTEAIITVLQFYLHFVPVLVLCAICAFGCVILRRQARVDMQLRCLVDALAVRPCQLTAVQQAALRRDLQLPTAAGLPVALHHS